ncbi:MAG: surf-like protein [Bathelium mastoideum]|nr:MAG: surf-like protein [Bathelium mastoideum]
MSLLRTNVQRLNLYKPLFPAQLPTKPRLQPPWTCSRCLRQRRRYAQNAADDPNFSSIVDHSPRLIRSGRRHNYVGIIILALIPVTAFALGTWQVQRLSWKTALIARLEDRLVRDPLPLPPRIDADAIPSFDHRRVRARGRFRHDQEMLLGPRVHDGHDGFLVITPLERSGRPEGAGVEEADGGAGDTILVNRGWIAREKRAQRDRRGQDALPTGWVTVEGLLREPWRRNAFTPANRPEQGAFYFPDVGEMAAWSGAAPVWVEETMDMDLLMAMDREDRGVPIGRAAEVNLRNNHLQYIFTW